MRDDAPRRGARDPLAKRGSASVPHHDEIRAMFMGSLQNLIGRMADEYTGLQIHIPLLHAVSASREPSWLRICVTIIIPPAR
jgi:hypothetical protein